MTLDQLAPHQSSRVTTIEGREAFVQRLMAMGFLPGSEVTIVRVAPFGDPIEVELDGWRVALRLGDAASVGVNPTGPVGDPGNGNGKGNG